MNLVVNPESRLMRAANLTRLLFSSVKVVVCLNIIELLRARQESTPKEAGIMITVVAFIDLRLTSQHGSNISIFAHNELMRPTMSRRREPNHRPTQGPSHEWRLFLWRRVGQSTLSEGKEEERPTRDTCKGNLHWNQRELIKRANVPVIEYKSTWWGLFSNDRRKQKQTYDK